MKKLFYLMTVSLAVLALNSCQKEDADQAPASPEVLLSQNPEYARLKAKYDGTTREDIMAILEKKGVEAHDAMSISTIEGASLKSTNEPTPGAITLVAEPLYYIYVQEDGAPIFTTLMKFYWDCGGYRFCAEDYAGQDWIYRIKYSWIDLETEEIHHIRLRHNSCITDGTGSQDHCYCTNELKAVSVLGEWYFFNQVTRESILVSDGYIVSDVIYVNTTDELCEELQVLSN